MKWRCHHEYFYAFHFKLFRILMEILSNFYNQQLWLILKRSCLGFSNLSTILKLKFVLLKVEVSVCLLNKRKTITSESSKWNPPSEKEIAFHTVWYLPNFLFITLGTKPIFVFLISSQFMSLVEFSFFFVCDALYTWNFLCSCSGENCRGRNKKVLCEKISTGRRKGGIER